MTAATYNKHFGFQERPFSLSPDPEFLVWSETYSQAFSVLEYGIVHRAALTVMTGEVGIGKTTLVQALLDKIEETVTVGLISNLYGGHGTLLRWAMNAFNVPIPENADYVDIFQTLQDFIVAEYAAGRNVLLIIDEAQNLDMDTLEELRLLTNINLGKDDPLQIILVGQPPLRDTLRLNQLAQRVMVTFHLESMSLKSTLDYVTHRLHHAGGTGQEFTVDAIRRIHDEAGGIPRMVNKLCDLALTYAASAHDKHVDLAAVEELLGDGLVFRSSRPTLVLSNRVAETGKAAE